MSSFERRLTVVEAAVGIAYDREQLVEAVTTQVRRLALERGLYEADIARAVAYSLAVLDAWTDKHEQQVLDGVPREIVCSRLSVELRLCAPDIAEDAIRAMADGLRAQGYDGPFTLGLSPPAPAPSLTAACTHRSRCACPSRQRRPTIFRLSGD